MSSKLFQRLRNQLAGGGTVLFTGAGFSRAAPTLSGDPVLSVDQLKRELWRIGVPNEPYSPATELGDVYDVAFRRARGEVGAVLQRSFSVHAPSLPDWYELWYSMPWYCAYTLNVDDLDEAASTRFALPRRVRSVSALKEGPVGYTSELASVHINGRAKDFPDVTFSPMQFAERTALPDPWYQHLVTDIAGHAVVFVGTQLNEPPLWHYLELRRSKGGRGTRELRPGSYLVVPTLDPAKRALLEQFNIDWVPMNAEQFAREVLAEMPDVRERGIVALRDMDPKKNAGRTLVRVSEARTELAKDLPEFLLGREPMWADLTEGFAVLRDFEPRLEEAIADERPQLVILTGTAGSGKSTTLKRLALRMQTEGKDVRWLDTSAGLSAWQLRRAVTNERFDVLAIDDVDMFGPNTGPVLREITADNPNLMTIVAARSTRFEQLRVEDELKGVTTVQSTIPHLEDSDITLLLSALKQANRLGELVGKNEQQQIAAFRDHAGRQLLVAMLEATLGEKLEQKIGRECEELGQSLGFIYAVATVASALQYSLSRDEIVLAIGDTGNEALNDVQRLVNQHLLIPNGAGLRVRHRVIAEKALDHFRRQGQLGDAIRGLIWAMGTKVHSAEELRSRREGRLLMRMLNHDWLIKMMDAGNARETYSSVENLLPWNYHYWLQRGSLEVEVGNLRLAHNFLAQAKGMEPEDYKVRTEWAYMMLKRAAQEAESPEAPDWAEEAFAELEDVMYMRGRADSYAYHVYGSQGLSWVRRARMTASERRRTMERIRNVIKEGADFHPRARDIAQLASDIEREYLMLAVPEPKASDGSTSP